MTEPDSRVLELYRLAVEMADRVSARRGTANQFYLTLESLLLGVPAVFQGVGDGADAALRTQFLAALGAVVAVVWWLQLRSYRDLNKAKFSVILAIERSHLPLSVFDDEWAELGRDKIPKWRGRYAELGTVERVVPWLFFLVNVVLIFVVGR